MKTYKDGLNECLEIVKSFDVDFRNNITLFKIKIESAIKERLCNTDKPQEKIAEVIKETIEEIEYWHSDMLSEEERAHPRCNGWARVYDKLKDLL